MKYTRYKVAVKGKPQSEVYAYTLKEALEEAEELISMYGCLDIRNELGYQLESFIPYSELIITIDEVEITDDGQEAQEEVLKTYTVFGEAEETLVDKFGITELINKLK